jgi:hypothetical protein
MHPPGASLGGVHPFPLRMSSCVQSLHVPASEVLAKPHLLRVRRPGRCFLDDGDAEFALFQRRGDQSALSAVSIADDDE